MGKHKRRQRSKTHVDPQQSASTPTPPFNNPFGTLSELREELPPTGKTAALGPPDSEPQKAALDGCGKVVVQREKKGRAGKTVTRVTGLPKDRLDEVAKRIKPALGCGATRDGDELIVQGSLVEGIAQWLEGEGARHVVISGVRGKTSGGSRRQPPSSATESFGSPSSWREATRRDDLEPGLTVDIVLKKDQRTGALTRGVIQAILTRSATHPRGIKVRLDDGSVGRVKHVFEEPGS